MTTNRVKPRRLLTPGVGYSGNPYGMDEEIKVQTKRLAQGFANDELNLD